MEATTQVPTHLLQHVVSVFSTCCFRIAHGNRLRLFSPIAPVCPPLFRVAGEYTLPRDHLCIVRNQCDTLALFASRNCPFASFLSFLVQFQPIRYHPHSRITVSHPSRLEGRPARVQRNTSHFVGGTLLLLSALPDFAESLHNQTRHPERVPDTLGWDHFWIVYVEFAVAYDG